MIQQVSANERKQARQARSFDAKSKVRFEIVGRKNSRGIGSPSPLDGSGAYLCSFDIKTCNSETKHLATFSFSFFRYLRYACLDSFFHPGDSFVDLIAIHKLKNARFLLSNVERRTL